MNAASAVSGDAQVLVPLIVGVAFGFVLERSGLGSSRRVAAQFCGRDFTVLKVMFTAIVVAMLGAFWLARLGVIDLSAVYVPETYLLPQVAGALLFGAGMVVAGLCPGTACVSAATGRRDGVVVVAGMMVSVTTIGFLFSHLQSFHSATFHGSLRLPDLTGLPYGVVVLAVVLVAVSAFIAAEWLERA